VYNIISLEITGTPLAKKVTPPRIVREIDWVDNYWHFEGGRKKAIASAQKEGGPEKDGSLLTQDGDGWVQDKAKAGAKWPKVQLYCLMGIKGSWTVSDSHGWADDRIGMSTLPPVQSIIRSIPVPRCSTSSSRLNII
jgi:hypothetical protein